MAKTYINNNTLHYALKTLDCQKGHAEYEKTKEQKAYYEGILDGINLIISDIYAFNKMIVFNKELNTHKVITKRTKKLQR